MNKDLVILNARGGGRVVRLPVNPYDEDWLYVKEALEKLGFTFRRPEGR
jgi:hypothetical protein